MTIENRDTIRPYCIIDTEYMYTDNKNVLIGFFRRFFYNSSYYIFHTYHCHMDSMYR